MIALYKDPEGKYIFDSKGEELKSTTGHSSNNLTRSQSVFEGKAEELKLTTGQSRSSFTRKDSTLNTSSGTS